MAKSLAIIFKKKIQTFFPISCYCFLKFYDPSSNFVKIEIKNCLYFLTKIKK